MLSLTPLLLCLIGADAPKTSNDEFKWEEFINDNSLEAWTIRKEATKKVEGGCVHLPASEKGEELKLERTLGDFELSYEFKLDKGVEHELWLELVNGLLLIGAGYEREYGKDAMQPDRWHKISIVRHPNEAFVSLDDKKLPTKPMSLGAVTLRFVGAGEGHVRKIRLLDESTTLRPGNKAKDHNLLGLKGLPHLKIVDVSDSAVTDAGAAHLANFKSLRWVDFRGTKVSKAQVEKLQKALPECFILRDDGKLRPSKEGSVEPCVTAFLAHGRIDRM